MSLITSATKVIKS